ncbi:MAG: 16S rRNA (cytidine(1402)-2'-O)-methyltransferase [Myxococcota bacterium]|nr:16S rRNA (cytidine(1402)-2'-O)-methyltransferase [Myxococcota bacterium]
MGTIQVVATPIGNLEDMTLRGLRALVEADRIYAEDTRRTRVLLDHHGIQTKTISLHTGNEEARLAQALAQLDAGECLALVSDAGTPLISDPGARLIASAADAGHRVEPIPGPSAVLAALSVSGLRAHPFTFLGFLPRRSGARRRLLGPYRDRSEALVLFESPNRLTETLADLVAVFGPERRACVARELTKIHEEVVRGSLEMLAKRFAGEVRGEVTLVVEGGEGAESAFLQPFLEEHELELRMAELAAEGRRPREIAALLAPLSPLPRRELYARAVAQQKAAEGAGKDEPEASRG